MMQEITSIVEITPVFLIRNPCGYVSSLKRLNWDPSVRINAILNSPIFIEKLRSVNPEILELKKMVDGLGFIELVTVQYCLLLHLIEHFTREFSGSCYIYYYDRLAQNPLDGFRRVYTDLGLQYRNSDYQRHQHLTSGIGGKSQKPGTHDTKRNATDAHLSWRKNLSTDEISTVMKLWKCWGLQKHDFDFYQVD